MQELGHDAIVFKGGIQLWRGREGGGACINGLPPLLFKPLDKKHRPWTLLSHLQALDALEHDQVVPGRRHGLNLDVGFVRDKDLQHQPPFAPLLLVLIVELCCYASLAKTELALASG